MRRGQQEREGILQSVDAPRLRIGKEPWTAEAAAAVDMRTSTCARKQSERQAQTLVKAAGYFRYESGRHEHRTSEQYTQERRTQSTKENGNVGRQILCYW